MRGPVPVVRFILLALAYFLLLMLIGLDDVYPRLFRGGANLLFHSCGSGRIARFEPFDDPRGVFDTKMLVGTNSRGTAGFGAGLGVNSVRQGYVPTALLVALVLATPLAWKRRLMALTAGLLLVQVFVAMRVGVALFRGFNVVGEGQHRLLELSRFWAWALHRADQLLAADLHTTYVIPLLIWVLVMIPSHNVVALWRTASSESGAAGSARPVGE